MLTCVQPVERLGLSPMESEICPLNRAASTRGKTTIRNAIQLSQAHSRSFWDGDFTGPAARVSRLVETGRDAVRWLG
jgi:hypothetical protein